MSIPPTPEVPESEGSPVTPDQAQQATPPQYAPPQYAKPQYAQPQYAQPQYAQPQYAQPQDPQPQYTQPQYTQPQQPQYAPPPQYTYQQPQQQPYSGYALPQYPTAFPAPGSGEPFDGAQHPGELNRPLYGANMGQAFTRFFRNYANFSGRASRSEYWWVQLIFGLAYIGFAVIGGIIAAVAEQADPYGYGGGNAVAGLLGLILLIALLGVIIPSIALTWRRMHDANLAGPLYLLILVPYAGSLVIFIFTLLSPKPTGRRFDRPIR